MMAPVKGVPGRVTSKNVAQALGVSTAAVSYAFTRPNRLSPQLRRRILETADRLGYAGPHPVARHLRVGRTGVIGVVCNDSLPEVFSVPSTALFLQGVANVVEAAKMCVLLIPGTLRKLRNLQPVTQAAVDGLIVYSVLDGDPLIEAVLARRVPTVVVDTEAMQNLIQVGIDNEKAAQMAAEHLLQLGHRRIGVLTLSPGLDTPSGLISHQNVVSADSSDFRRRMKGYTRAFQEAGLRWEENISVYNCPDHSWIGGATGARALANLHPRPTAILATSDLLALGAIQGLGELGLRVPADLSVVGFDDIPDASLSRPALTTVHQPLVDKGYWASQILLALLERTEPPQPGVLATRLVIRESTAPPPRSQD